MNIEKTVSNLKIRGFQVSCFNTSAEAAEYLNSAIKGTSVGIGGSKTIEALGLYETLSENNTVYWHWKVPGRPTLDIAATTDVYMCSANAISEDGEIFNIDGNGNRIASTVFGHKKIYIVAGVNKICPDFDSALHRARNVAGVKNCKRFNKPTPCSLDDTCHDCMNPERICRALTVLMMPINGMETEIVLINEELGM